MLKSQKSRLGVKRVAYNNKNLEILAPAGNFDSLKAAVLSGADAVYFGAKALNARRNAANFSDEEIKEAVEFCHLYNVKAYLTLNTIMFDTEIQLVTDEIINACQIGFDALIVQDLGVVKLIKQICPQMPIHASTQMSVHNLADANALYELGIHRVVLAREMSRQEISNIITHSKIETEIFVHGALCYCVSGQCYFSAFLGERSGNRGLCAQACRLPFGVKDNMRYNLSLKDLTLIEYTDELKHLGIHSMKIEGRMKSADYVKTTVTQFRNALRHKKYDMQILKDSFSRGGFTQGYYLSKIDENMFGIRNQQDILKSKHSSQISADNSAAIRRIAIDMKFYICQEKSELIITDDFGDMFISQSSPAQPSITKSLTYEDVVQSLSKLNNTPFSLTNINGYVQENCYLSLSALNEMRRTVMEGLIKQRQYRKPYIFHIPNIIENSFPKKIPVNLAFTASFREISQMSERLLDKTAYACIDLFKLSQLSENMLRKYQDTLVAELPRVYFENEQTLAEQLIKLKQYGIHIAKCHSLGRMRLAKELGYEVIGGFGLNIANSMSADMLTSYSPLYITLSPELTAKQLNQINATSKTAVIGYGHFPLMLSRACPVKTEIGCAACKKKYPSMLTDRKGTKFSVLCNHGLSEILNSVPIYLADKTDDFDTVDFMELYFTTENERKCFEILLNYQKKLPANEPFTRGIAYRKLL
jgi:putative protease